MSAESPVPDASWLATLATIEPSSAQGAGGNQLNLAGVALDGYYWVALDNPWSDEIHVTSIDSSGIVRHASNVSVSESETVEFLSMGGVEGEPFLVFRDGLTRMVMISARDEGRRFVFDVTTNVDANAVIIGLDVASDGNTTLVGFGSTSISGTTQVLIDVAPYIASGSRFGWSTMGAVQNGAVAVHNEAVAIAWPKGFDEIHLALRPQDESFEEKGVIYSEPESDGPLSVPFVDIQVADQRSIFAIQQQLPLYGGFSADDGLYIREFPGTDWTRIADRSLDFPAVRQHRDDLLISARSGAASFDLIEVQDLVVNRTTSFDCVFEIVATGEELAFLFLDNSAGPYTMRLAKATLNDISTLNPCGAD